MSLSFYENEADRYQKVLDYLDEKLKLPGVIWSKAKIELRYCNDKVDHTLHIDIDGDPSHYEAAMAMIRHECNTQIDYYNDKIKTEVIRLSQRYLKEN